MNFKKLKMNRILLFVAIIAVIVWMYKRSGRRIEYNEGVEGDDETIKEDISDGKMTQEELDTLLKFIKP